MFLVIEICVIGDYLELGIWLLEFYTFACQLTESAKGGMMIEEIGSRFPLKGPLEQASNEFLIAHSLNFDGPGHSGLGRDIRVRIDF